MEFDSTYINYHHLSLLCDRMTMSYKMISIFRHGINNDNIGPIAKASFEETPEMFLKAAKHSELDEMRGVSANIMCGQEGYFGTGSFQVVLDINKMSELATEEKYTQKDTDDFIEKEFTELENTNEFCSIANMSIYSNITNSGGNTFNDDDDYEIDF
jgi:DNA-directed RNA polymerase II subunit RPB1